MTNTDVLVYHGATDAPAVDVVEVSAGLLVDSITYGDFSDDYLELPTADYTLQVQSQTGAVVASYSAPLSTLSLDGQAAVVLASGFLDSTMNNDGPAFGLWVALPAGGELVPLPAATSTSLMDANTSELTLFPNPANDQIFISGKTGLFRIFSSTGHLVRNGVILGKEPISLQGLESGIYFFQIDDSKLKFIKN